MKNSPHVFAFLPVCRKSSRSDEAVEALRQLGLKDVSLENRLEVRNENGSHEIVLIGAVGRSYWDESGITEKEFRNALNTIPKGSPITVLVNSEGGSVQDGLGIYNAIKERSADITARITGYAVSIASVFPLAASKVISPKSAIWMTHKAWAYAQGNDEDMDAAAQMLREHNRALVDIYVEETGKTAAEWEAWMKAETWIRGASAVEYGLADETEEDKTQASYRPLRPDFIQRCKNLSPEILNAISAAPKQGSANQPKLQLIMNRTQMLALLKSWGVDTSDSMTDEQIVALVGKGKPQAAPQPDNVLDLQTQIDGLKAQNAKEKKDRIERALDQLVVEERITRAQRDTFLPKVISDETFLDTLKALDPRPKPAEPVGSGAEITAESSVVDLVKASKRFSEPMQSWQRGNDSITMKDIAKAATDKAHFFTKHAKRISEVWNANTIDAVFKRAAILDVVIKDFARRLIPLNLFSTVFSNVPLQGNNKVEVGFLDLDTVASISWDPAVGYTNPGGTVLDKREIEVGTGAANGDRLRVGMSFSSEEMARQPYLKIVEFAQMKVNKLASDVIADILSIVTAANYGAAAISTAAALFDSDDLADLKLACKLWPEEGRGLLLDSAYDANLLKDPSFKHAMNAASDSAIKEGKLFPRVMGFNYYEFPTIPTNGEGLVGMAIYKSAILVATAPVPPLQEVRNAGTTYEVIVEPTTGVAFEYRSFGDNILDTASHWVELSYGFAKGNGNALKRITT